MHHAAPALIPQDMEVIKFLITLMSNLDFKTLMLFYNYAAQRCLQKLRVTEKIATN